MVTILYWLMYDVDNPLLESPIILEARLQSLEGRLHDAKRRRTRRRSIFSELEDLRRLVAKLLEDAGELALATLGRLGARDGSDLAGRLRCYGRGEVEVGQRNEGSKKRGTRLNARHRRTP